jgi:hypothetical protein
MTAYLSKSLYLSGLQCHKRLWLEVNAPTRPALSAAQQRMVDQGTEVGKLARQFFPEGLLIDASFSQVEQAIAQTQSALQAGVTTLFEAAFRHDNIFVRCDILRRLGEQEWELIEVKSATEVKNEHLDDLAIQKYVLAGCGLIVRQSSLMHINSQDCCFPDLSNLFVLEDVTIPVNARQTSISLLLDALRLVLKQTSTPNIPVGQHCHTPYPCPFKTQCWQHIPEKSIFTIPRLSSKKQTELLKRGIVHLNDLPANYPLTSPQRAYVDSVLNTTARIDYQGIAQKLNELEFPLHFFDIETDNPSIPRFNHLKPYSHFPFQYSCHILHADGKLAHGEYLHTNPDDPRIPWIDSLLTHVADQGSVIAYNASFESRILLQLANAFPHYAEFLVAIADRLWDLMDIFKLYYQHPDFCGSYSIKKVLPVLVPHLSYQALAVQQGDEAQAVWQGMIHLEAGEEKLQKIAALKAYCRMDTLGMVEIYRSLCKFIVSY